MKKLYYIRTNAYDCIISEDKEDKILRIYNGVYATEHDSDDTPHMDVYLDEKEFKLDCPDGYEAGYINILSRVGDDSSWEEIDWCDVSEVFDDAYNVPDGSRILAEIDWEG